MPKKTSSKAEISDTGWSTLKAIALGALGKGHVPFISLCITILFLMLLWKLDSKDIVQVVRILVDGPIFALCGWGIAIGEIIVMRYENHSHKRELARLVDARDAAQKLVIPQIKSSSQPPTFIE